MWPGARWFVPIGAAVATAAFGKAKGSIHGFIERKDHYPVSDLSGSIADARTLRIKAIASAICVRCS